MMIHVNYSAHFLTQRKTQQVLTIEVPRDLML